MIMARGAAAARLMSSSFGTREVSQLGATLPSFIRSALSFCLKEENSIYINRNFQNPQPIIQYILQFCISVTFIFIYIISSAIYSKCVIQILLLI
ncbi:hypothetical protein FGO68_gene11650 [Halteria grandinella]|uniref:Uncharacterized protein n=1 Tax=Halteria grandinella TaxID=5974 RepID=A0A8J8T1C0_HALGN|nr:hypothetical protein FGO68_gene11650 [Halteria grandinella]